MQCLHQDSRFKKVYSFLLSILLLFQPAGHSETVADFRPVSSVSSISPILIPPELGRIDRNSKIVSTDAPLIFHIQDVHGDYGVENNVRKIAEFLSDRYGIRFFFSEAAQGRLDERHFRFFEKPVLNLKLAETLMRDGEFDGLEMFILRRAGEQHKARSFAYGVENKNLYRRNFHLFRNVMSKKEISELFLNALDRRLDSLAGQIFSRKLRDLVRLWRKFHKTGYTDMMPLVWRLQKLARTHLSFHPSSAKFQDRFPSLFRFFRMKTFESQLDWTRAEAERKALRFESLLQEIDTIMEQLFSVMARAAEEKELILLIHSVDLARKLMSLELGPRDWSEYKKSRAGSLGEIVSRIHALSAEVTGSEFPELERLEMRESIDIESDAVTFYRLAKKRERFFVQNMLRVMKEKGASRSVLFTGGFHAEGLAKYFQALGISYVSILPNPGSTHELLAGRSSYLNSMMGGSKSSIKSPGFLMARRLQESLTAQDPEYVREYRIPKLKKLSHAVRSWAASLGGQEIDTQSLFGESGGTRPMTFDEINRRIDEIPPHTRPGLQFLLKKGDEWEGGVLFAVVFWREADEQIFRYPHQIEEPVMDFRAFGGDIYVKTQVNSGTLHYHYYRFTRLIQAAPEEEAKDLQLTPLDPFSHDEFKEVLPQGLKAKILEYGSKTDLAIRFVNLSAKKWFRNVLGFSGLPETGALYIKYADPKTHEEMVSKITPGLFFLSWGELPAPMKQAFGPDLSAEPEFDLARKSTLEVEFVSDAPDAAVHAVPAAVDPFGNPMGMGRAPSAPAPPTDPSDPFLEPPAEPAEESEYEAWGSFGISPAPTVEPYNPFALVQPPAVPPPQRDTLANLGISGVQETTWQVVFMGVSNLTVERAQALLNTLAVYDHQIQDFIAFGGDIFVKTASGRDPFDSQIHYYHFTLSSTEEITGAPLRWDQLPTKVQEKFGPYDPFSQAAALFPTDPLPLPFPGGSSLGRRAAPGVEGASINITETFRARTRAQIQLLRAA
ncbi:MAG: hypothetical protein HY586_07970 [Candidatus Omnitrophica bacterium]|nr:hypothetical protein [Candidatus Omnitrophota bacterium]